MKYVRFPKTDNHSLRAWNASDELIVDQINSHPNLEDGIVLLLNDRFGYLRHNLDAQTIVNYIESKSQLDSIIKNNSLDAEDQSLITDLKLLPKSKIVLISAPKSLVLFELYLDIAARRLTDGGTVMVGFMTKYFTKSWLKIAARYFEEAQQSLARKKARTLQLLNPTTLPNAIQDQSTKIIWQGQSFSQYKGVFSDQKVDIATQFLLDSLSIERFVGRALDIGTGNGIIGWSLLNNMAISEVDLMDDYLPAVHSAQLNIQDSRAQFFWDYNLDRFQSNYYDLVISNPPFHFGFDLDITIPLNLMKSTHRILKDDGHLIIVGNRHINYGKTLSSLFSQVNIMGENNKFIIWELRK